MGDSRDKNTFLMNAFEGNRKRCTRLHDDLNALSRSGIQKAKECIDVLKFSEGLVRRDIDLVRMQLEIKLKKLESRLQAELRNVVEKETAKLEKFIGEVKALENTSLNEEKQRDAIRELESIAAGMETKRLKLEVNKSLELSLKDIKSFGNIVVHTINVSEPVNRKGKPATDKPPMLNGLRRLSLDSGFSEIKTPLAEQCEAAKPTHKHSERPSSTSSDRDCDYRKSEAGTMSDRFSYFDHDTNLNKTGGAFQQRSVEQVNEPCKETKDTARRLNDTVKSISLESVVFANRNHVGITNMRDNNISGPVNVTRDDTDWAKADPFSILRALKEQTSKTEEHLKALGLSNTGAAEDKETPKVESNPARQDNVKQPVVDSNKRISKSGRSITTKASGSEKANSRGPISIRSNSAKSRYVTGCQDNEQDRFEHLDKVTRANALWFGRDRQRQRCDDLKRRARSLSPKTVRFRMEEEEAEEEDEQVEEEEVNVCNDKEVDLQIDPCGNDNGKSRRYLIPFKTVTRSKHYNTNGVIHASGGNETQMKLMSDKDISERCVYTGTGYHDEMSHFDQPQYDGRCDNRQSDSYGNSKKDSSKFHNNVSFDTNPLYHRRKHSICHQPDNVSSKCQDNAHDKMSDLRNGNRSNDLHNNCTSAKDQQTASTGDIIQKLSNKQTRNRHIWGQTNNVHNHIRIPLNNPESITSVRNNNSSHQSRGIHTERVQNSSAIDNSVVQLNNKSPDIFTDLKHEHLTPNSGQTHQTDETGISQRIRDKRSRNTTIWGLNDHILDQTLAPSDSHDSSFINNKSLNHSSFMHRGLEHNNHKPNDIGNYAKNGNQSLESLQSTSTGENERILRLRNKRIRNKTIGGLTDSVHSHIGSKRGPFSHTSDTNPSNLSMPLHTNYDQIVSENLHSRGNSFRHDSNTSGHLTSSNTEMQVPLSTYAPRRRLFSDISKRASKSMQPEKKTTNGYTISETVLSNAVSDAMDLEQEKTPQNNLIKVKEGKQRMPSCKDMLFLG